MIQLSRSTRISCLLVAASCLVPFGCSSESDSTPQTAHQNEPSTSAATESGNRYPDVKVEIPGSIEPTQLLFSAPPLAAGESPPAQPITQPNADAPVHGTPDTANAKDTPNAKGGNKWETAAGSLNKNAPATDTKASNADDTAHVDADEATHDPAGNQHEPLAADGSVDRVPPVPPGELPANVTPPEGTEYPQTGLSAIDKNPSDGNSDPSDGNTDRLPSADEQQFPADDFFARHRRQPASARTAQNQRAPDHFTSTDVVEEPGHVRDHAAPDQAMTAVLSGADRMVKRGFSLAMRGATFSARAEFIRALRLVSQALDARETGERNHSRSLAAGLRALAEADDFVPTGSRLEADLNIASLVAAHQTAVLKDRDLESMMPLTALKEYYSFARQELANAAGHYQPASLALHGLGKVQMVLGQTDWEKQRNGPKAMTFFQAALDIDNQNHLAANELGVLLARYGQLEHARDVLQHAVSVYPIAETWYNLSRVHERLGETDLARRSRYEWQLTVNQQPPSAGRQPNVQWVAPDTFARMAPDRPASQPAGRTTHPASSVRPPSGSARESSAERTHRWLPFRRNG